MTVLSKFAASIGFRPLVYNCYEVGHAWESSCTSASAEVFLAALKESFRIYLTLYTISGLYRISTGKKLDGKKWVKDLARSTIFLTSNGFYFIAGLCVLRHLIGFFTYPTIGYVPGIVASFIAINIEQASRRTMLANYVLQIASELRARSLVHRRIVPSIPYLETIIFSLSLGVYMYLYRIGEAEPVVQKVVKYIFNIPNASSMYVQNHTIPPEPEAAKKVRKAFGIIPVHCLRPSLKAILERFRARPDGQICTSHPNSCVSECFEVTIRNFVYGFAARFGVNLVTSIPGAIRDRSLRPFATALLNPSNLNFALFVGILPGLFKGTKCLLNVATQSDREPGWKWALSGAVAGTAMYYNPSVSIAQYFTWKLLEMLYVKGVKRGLLPEIPNANIILYSLATGYILHAGVFEPHCLRPAYWNFLKKLTGTRFLDVHRVAFDIYGCDSSHACPDYYPQNIDVRSTTCNPELICSTAHMGIKRWDLNNNSL